MSEEVALGVVRSFAAGPPRTAAVRVVGGLETGLSAVPVAAHVLDADVTAGRECLLAYLEPNDPRSAVLVGVVGTSVGGGGGTPVAVQEGDVTVVTVASYLDFGLGFDVTEGPAGEANVALDLTESVWTFAQGGFQFRDGSGPLLFTGASGNDLFLTGDLDVSGVMAVGSGGVIESVGRMALRVAHSCGNISVINYGAGVDCRLTNNSATTGFAYGVYGYVSNVATAACSVAGLMFGASHAGAYTCGWLHGLVIMLSSAGGCGAIMLSKGLEVTPSYGTNTPATYYGVHLLTHASMQTAYGVRVEDMTGTTIRLLEIGPATPYLRLVGGAAPAAGQTNLYLAEGVTPTLRRVQWKLYSALVAGDMVMVLV